MTKEEVISTLKVWVERDKAMEYADREENIEIYKMAIKALEQQSSEDCISRAYIESIVEELENICINGDEYMLSLLSDIKNAPSVTPQQTSWIPIKTRPMTEEEKEHFFEYADRRCDDTYTILDCPLPDDGQEVILSVNGYVSTDIFCRDSADGCYFESYDIDDVDAWMPLPEPYKTESEEA